MSISKCRTCATLCNERSYELSSPVSPSGTIFSHTSIKKALIMIIPEMENTLSDTEVVCNDCRKILTLILKFIHKCLQVEADFSETRRTNNYDFKEYINNRVNKSELKTDNNGIDTDYQTLENVDDMIIKSEMSFIDDHNYDDPILSDHMHSLPENTEQINTIVSITSVNPDVLSNFACDLTVNDVEVYQYAFNLEKKNKKRILILASAVENSRSCKRCGEELANNLEYRKHMQMHRLVKKREARHKIAEEQRAAVKVKKRKSLHIIQCTVCSQSMSTKQELEEHQKIHPQYTCEQCGKNFISKTLLSQHYRTHGTPNVICEICGKAFKTKTNLRHHSYTHGERIYSCKVCHKKFKSPSCYKKHSRIHEGNPKEECKICGKKVVAMTQHYQVVHLKKIKAECVVCGKRFTRHDYFRQHLKSHQNAANRQHLISPDNSGVRTRRKRDKLWCEICGEVFKTFNSLYSHKRSHSIVNKYRCKYCGLSFRQPGSKLRHEKAHENDPKYNLKCPICWRRFQSQKEIDEHVAQHRKPYKCQICDLDFGRQYLLNHHITEVHADETDQSVMALFPLMLKKHPSNYNIKEEIDL